MSDEKIELLKKKLLISIQARQSLEKSYEKQFNTLTSFIVKLTNTAKGIDVELDNRLGKLRTFLNQNTNITKIDPLLNELNQLLNQHTSKHAQQLLQAQETLLKSAKTLQKFKHLPDEFRRKLRTLIKDIEQPQTSIIHLLPILTRLVESYQSFSVLQNKEQEEPDGDVFTAEQNQVLNGLRQQVAAELVNILSNIAFSGEQAEKIDQVRHTLSQDVTTETLVSSCVEVIRLVVSSITEERQSAQSFLFSLNDALNSVHHAVATSINGSKAINESKQKLNEQLKNNLVGMSEEVSKATSLDSLKQQINLRIKDIVDALNQKESLESEEHQLLIDSLSEMESRLKDLEVEAEEYKKKLSEQRFKSLQDMLTKLPNRASLDERMELEYRRWMRYSHDLCVVVADIDHFKSINDKFGHSVGDRVLQIVAATLQKGLRETDYIARYGGEEFVLIFPESKLKEIESKLNHLREAISNIPFKFKNADLKVTISMGATQFKAIDQPQSAFDRADQALYQAKSSGRNKVIITR
ncbi:diguanylate cyclase [Catenovulum sp. 2E275]|uniref:GGDEF domain-containing protein n=1 Tax=Catenovulum sp. 2E275 TaxID=2980497 RepID=UPI0021CF8566|nr:GGDEF domain-containing protein [Catenovulum sp. 2E275]MCU4676082.1 diguanylate cyclase [Catenovulum sp. 2E275]